jgi:hypothetical protein
MPDTICPKGRKTVRSAEPDWPSLVAVIVAVPDETAVTVPPASTVATLPSDEDQAMSRPVTISPPANFVSAVRSTEAPIAMTGWLGDTVTVATGGGVTVIIAVPDLPSLVAVIVASPSATAVTSPEDETVAAAVFDDDQVTVRPVRVLPSASFVTALSETVAPTATSADAGSTATDATGVGLGSVGLSDPQAAARTAATLNRSVWVRT